MATPSTPAYTEPPGRLIADMAPSASSVSMSVAGEGDAPIPSASSVASSVATSCESTTPSPAARTVQTTGKVAHEGDRPHFEDRGCRTRRGQLRGKFVFSPDGVGVFLFLQICSTGTYHLVFQSGSTELCHPLLKPRRAYSTTAATARVSVLYI